MISSSRKLRTATWQSSAADHTSTNALRDETTIERLEEAMTSMMRRTMERQAADLRTLHTDAGRTQELAALLPGHRVFLIGTGTSWHEVGS